MQQDYKGYLVKFGSMVNKAFSNINDKAGTL